MILFHKYFIDYSHWFSFHKNLSVNPIPQITNNRGIKWIHFYKRKFCQTEHTDNPIEYFMKLTFSFHHFNIFTGLGDFLCISNVYTQGFPLGRVYSRFQVKNNHNYSSPAHNPVTVRFPFWGLSGIVHIRIAMCVSNDKQIYSYA